MSYKVKTNLLKQTNKLPLEAKEVYKSAFNSAEKFYSNPKKREDINESKETVASKVAWSALKKKFKKVNDKWIKNNYFLFLLNG